MQSVKRIHQRLVSWLHLTSRKDELMKIKFIKGYQGVITKEIHYPEGTEIDLPTSQTERLIGAGYAVPLKELTPADLRPDSKLKRIFQRDTGYSVTIQVDATDSAKELAEKNSIDLLEVKGSGKDGRIIRKDVAAVV